MYLRKKKRKEGLSYLPVRPVCCVSEAVAVVVATSHGTSHQPPLLALSLRPPRSPIRTTLQSLTCTMRTFLPFSVLLLLVVGLSMIQQSQGNRPNFSRDRPGNLNTVQFAGGRPAPRPSTGALSGFGRGPPPPIFFGPRPRPRWPWG
ncbi:uncharacterized protein LOC123510908 [Portunus trituberculatus]|uniref:uncharacterized protein LOC123510908 n=1 Tax=Portunus trituberculatus TaxID=210409 RepID=UPI001E1CED92|nr:uncharacterized protein LOC123510908 [Portunus trituberculatus]